MVRLAAAVLFAQFAACTFAQTNSQSTAVSDPEAIALAQESIAALTSGAPISDVTLNANVVSIIGSDYETGTAVLRVKGPTESRIDLTLNGGSRSDVQNTTNGVPSGAWEINGGSVTPYAQHNCFVDASWFFPGLSSLTQLANPNYVLKYIGPETHNGLSVQHIQVFQAESNDGGLLQRLSTVDFFLNSASGFPVAATFSAHPDNNLNIDIPIEVRFANYQQVSGVQVPWHFQKLVNGNLRVDITVTNVALNSGILDTNFSLQ